MNLSFQSELRVRSVVENLVKATALLLVAGRFAVGSMQAQIVQAVESTIYSFIPANPTNGVLEARLIVGSDGALYGVGSPGDSTFGGAVFKINRDGSGYQVLHNFGSITNDGLLASATKTYDDALLLGSDNALYGTTSIGGANGDGIIYRITEDGSDYRILHSFDNSQNDRFPITGVIQAASGVLYGTTAFEGPINEPAAVFSINPDGSDYTVLTNISYSAAALLQGQDGALYGTTTLSNQIFRINLDGSGLTILHTFSGTDGSAPIGQLIQSVNGFLLGATWLGGTSNFGTLFMISTNGDDFQVLHNFSDGEVSGDGQIPHAGLALGPGNLFYGTTSLGGTYGYGTVFKINQDGSGYEQLYSFPPSGQPESGLVQGQSQGNPGVLYGTAGGVGSSGAGFIYAILVNPPLSITPVTTQTASNQVTVSWPAWALNYVLQSTTNLSSSNWVNVSNGVPVTGVQLTNPANPGTFYRLVAPN